MSLIRLVNAGYQYPGSAKWIFRGLAFTVDAREAVRLVGRNGSGKTTLLKVLSGLLPLTEGEIQREPGARTAYMDQFAGEMLARDLTIEEQLKMAMEPNNGLGASASDLLAQFDLGLQNRTNEFVGHLSGGQRQVVALLSTLAAGANVLCLDEFTSSMDDQSAAVASLLLQNARTTREAGLILVAHDYVGTQINREFSTPTV